ncbi:MAG: protein-glutamate O-methyltransferase CheR [Geobacter sp.]|nr:protein-glutamate O-methyltransferase CheR [Geobacter sp.]
MCPFEVEIPMTEEEFRLLRDLIYSHCGLWFDDQNSYLLQKRLGRRLAVHQLKSFREYYQLLRFNRKREQELEEIMDLLTTNETYFFREEYQLKAFADEIVPEMCAARGTKEFNHRIRVWSAGCSTGEEPYTIAMLLLEMDCLRDWSIEIVGTDISQRVLQHARRGVYGPSAFRSTDDYYKNKYFAPHEEGGYRIKDEVRKLVTISHLNLLDSTRMKMLGSFDLVFCRNVIIYFDQPAKKKVVESFYQVLRDSGYLLLGHSESLMNITTLFNLRHFKNDMVYQKPVSRSTVTGGVR